MSKRKCRCQVTLRADGTCPFGCEPIGQATRRRQSVGVRANDLGPGKVLSTKDMRQAMRRKFPGDSAKWNARTMAVTWKR